MKSPFPKLDEALGLHERLEVIYVIDGYQASLVNEYEQEQAHGNSCPTVYEAIAALEVKLP